ncbi:MAG: helix-turn-helix domain-containing protein [Bacteroidia bacterium]
MKMIFMTQEELSNALRVQIEKALDNFKPEKENEVSQNKLYSRKETADLLQISLPTLHHYSKNGYIKAKRIGNSIRYSWEDIQESLKDRRFKKGGSNV